MDKLERSYYEMALKVKFHELRGGSFQDFFSEVMERSHPNDFARVCPWGSSGDMKNDGYLRSERMLFGVYAPDTWVSSAAQRKIEMDFRGALPHWRQHFDVWVLVHNRTSGLPAPDLKKLLELEQEWKLLDNGVRITSWGYPELRKKVFALGEDDIASLLGLGRAPTYQGMHALGYAEIGVVLKGIEGRPPTPIVTIPPATFDKIKVNQLSNDSETLLIAGMRKSKTVEEFLRGYHNVTLGDSIAAAFKSEYGRLKSANLDPDEIFGALWRFAGGAERGAPKEESAVLAVLSYLFERCDIFESGAEDEK